MSDLPTSMNEENGKRAMSREEIALAFLNAAIKNDLEEHPPDALSDASASFYVLAQELAMAEPEWPSHQAHLIFQLGTGLYQQQADQIVKKKAEENRPKLLARKGYERVNATVKVEGRPVEIGKATAEQKRKSTKDLEALVKTYGRPRVSPEKLKEHKATLAQNRKFDRKVIPLTAGDKQMELGFAMEAFEATLETPRAKHYQAIASKGGKAKNRATKNQ